VILIADKVCEEVECGKGNCVVNTSYPLNFVCECDSGWKRTQDEDDDIYATSFLPCVIPQCKFNSLFPICIFGFAYLKLSIDINFVRLFKKRKEEFNLYS
jgi:hypothetical protein